MGPRVCFITYPLSKLFVYSIPTQNLSFPGVIFSVDQLDHLYRRRQEINLFYLLLLSARFFLYLCRYMACFPRYSSHPDFRAWLPEFVDTYKPHFGFTVFCKNEFFTKFLQFCKKFIFTIYRSCELGSCFQCFFGGFMLTSILYVFTDSLSSHPNTSSRVVVMIPPFPLFFGERFSVKCRFLPDLKLKSGLTVCSRPIALIDPQRGSPLSSFSRVGCNTWIPTPCKCKSIRVLSLDPPVRWRTWAIYRHKACQRSSLDPKSIVPCTFIYCRRLEFYRVQSYGAMSLIFSRNRNRWSFHLRYIRWFWHRFGLDRSCTGIGDRFDSHLRNSGCEKFLELMFSAGFSCDLRVYILSVFAFCRLEVPFMAKVSSIFCAFWVVSVFLLGLGRPYFSDMTCQFIFPHTSLAEVFVHPL